MELELLGFVISDAMLFNWGFVLAQILLVLIATKIVVKILVKVAAYVDKNIYDFPEHTHRIVVRVLGYIIYFGGFLVILNVLKLENLLVTALAGAGVMGLAIGFAAKDVISNMLSGIFINIDKPFRLGDIIEVKGTSGKVTDMGFRVTTIEAADGKVITIPNQIIAQDMVTNFTRKKTRWVKIPVSIAYEADLKRALSILNKILVKHKEILERPDPEVNITNFGDSGIALEIRGWVKTQSLRKMREIISSVSLEIKNEFDKAGIEIPYPRRIMISKPAKKKKPK